MITVLAVLALQALVPAGEYRVCTLSEAGSLSGPLPARWGLEFYEVPNYLFVDQPGQYELRGYKVHWVTGPLKGEAPGDYDPAARTIRFRPNVPAGGFPIAAYATCGLGDGVSRETSTREN